jgi:hypothetical protein
MKGLRFGTDLRWSLRMNFLPQTGHVKFFSPVWVRVWRASSSERAKRFPHPVQPHGNGRSPAKIKQHNSTHFTIHTCPLCRQSPLIFSLKVGWVRPKLGCLLTLAYYAFPRWYESGERRWNDILTGDNRRTRRKTCPSATLSTTNPTWIDPGANPGLHGEKPATNDPSHDTAQSTDSYIPGECIKRAAISCKYTFYIYRVSHKTHTHI